jgi:hypothetical protein
VVSAAQVTDLYQGKAPTSGDMTAAQSQALGRCSIKVTGKRDILTQPAVVKALAAPADYVQHYSYQDIGSVKFLKADFNVAKVNALVARASSPCWARCGRRSPSGWWSMKGSGAFCRISPAMAGPRRCVPRPRPWGCRSVSR